jgi:RNA recognition motif-containing protein
MRSTLSIYISRYIITKEDLKELFKKYGKLLEEKK